ncbi:hypothetical protein F52700_4447 [Fusarium sp. NRRL 52700]|nr:hypothetical protein F52700_4447 [Fusarium sp. NRRL 52700]
MSTEPFLNAVTMYERFMPYELGRQLQRFHDDHPGKLPMLTDKDWEWIRDVCSKPPTQPGEERYPAEWATSPESISNALPHWRRYMRYNHPYKGYVLKRSSPIPEGQNIGQEETNEMPQDAGSKVGHDVDFKQEGVAPGRSFTIKYSERMMDTGATG